MVLPLAVLGVFLAFGQQDASTVALGKKLFFDGRLSEDGSVSCATCHIPEEGFADHHAISPGVFGRKGNRHTPSLIARAAGALHFWDGRSPSLEQQVLEPIRNPNEMSMTVAGVVRRLREDPAMKHFTETTLAAALAAYVRTIRSEDAPADLFLKQGGGPLSPLALEGFRLFRDRARCYICHSGGQFTDESFHNTGIAWRNGTLLDEGRAIVTGKPYHRGAFKTPALREIARTAPYMHDGSIATLEAVVEFYDKGGNRNPWLDPNLQPLHLTPADKQALIAFLRALSGTVRDGL
ncbi:MAG: cytochrome-c peroxidase [Candidatus Solibacter usitatus]|nr:cytochrome-c peroxidase [Candidatus Solibacter usitatus]